MAKKGRKRDKRRTKSRRREARAKDLRRTQ